MTENQDYLLKMGGKNQNVTLKQFGRVGRERFAEIVLPGFVPPQTKNLDSKTAEAFCKAGA